MTKNLPVVFAWLLICSCLFSCGNKKTETLAPVQDTINRIDSTLVEKTFPDVISNHIRIVPTMNSVFSNGNTVYCSNVEYLLNALVKNSDMNISGNRLIKEFKQSGEWKNTMDTSSLVLAFGNPGEVYKSIIRQYKTKYKIDKTDLLPQGSTFWGYTDKVISYKYDEPFDEQQLLFLGTEVEAFGFNSEFSSSYAKDYFKNQFDILYFNTDGQFVVKLIPANTSDEIILVMLNKRGTFLEMFNASKKLIEKGIERIKQDRLAYNLNTEDELIIPAIRFKAFRDYSELKGLEFSSAHGPVDFFEQTINFRFDRKGVVLQADASMADSVGMPQKPKYLHFDKPFYLYVKEANASYPYFNLWISDPEILEKKIK